MTGREVYVRATNYDGSMHWEHAAWLVEATAEMIVTRTEAGLVIQREGGKTWTDPWQTRAYYWTDRWYNVIRLEEPDKGFAGYYCNIATPATFDGETVRYVDLQLDVRAYVNDDGSIRHELLDEDDFEAAKRTYAYPAKLIEKARGAVDEVVKMIEARAFPFDG